MEEKGELEKLKNKLIERISDLANLSEIHSSEELKGLFGNLLNQLEEHKQTSKQQEKVGFLGPKASFTHQAALEHFGKGASLISLHTIQSVFEALHTERIDFGVVPLENNQQGNVHETIFSLGNFKCFIDSEVALPIHFSLASNSKNVDEITTIYSKDIAFRQCHKFIEATFSHQKVTLEAVESTSKAVLLANENENSAAICSSIAAEEFNIPILFKNVEDSTDNFTRFLVISRTKGEKQGAENKTTILAKINDGPGDLVNFLNDFYKEGINLTKIESLPARKGKNFKYWFFIDLEGHEQDESIQKVLKKHKSDLKLLGSYEKKC